MDPILLVRTCFIAGVGIGIMFDAVPYFRTRYVDYGSRSKKTATASSPLALIDKLFAYPVPHSWFTHYYVLSVSLSLFWGYQIFTRGQIVVWVASLSSQSYEDSMSLQRIRLAWLLLLVQGVRRLSESVLLAKPSNATMPVSIYLIGMIYYILDSVGIWIEGSATLLATENTSWSDAIFRFRHGLAPSLRTFIILPVFILASSVQNDGHRYLASLKKYTLPTHPLFTSVVCPHYLMECVIYLSLAILAAPRGQILNKTIFTTFFFTTVNLGLVAKGTKEWAIEKFGSDVKSKWCMIPYAW